MSIEKDLNEAMAKGIDSSNYIEWRLRQPHEWGYRDIVSGEFIKDDDPFAAANTIVQLKALLKKEQRGITTAKDFLQDDCEDCGIGIAFNECDKSLKICGHHCEHAYIHDECCWCGERFEGES